MWRADLSSHPSRIEATNSTDNCKRHNTANTLHVPGRPHAGVQDVRSETANIAVIHRVVNQLDSVTRQRWWVSCDWEAKELAEESAIDSIALYSEPIGVPQDACGDKVEDGDGIKQAVLGAWKDVCDGSVTRVQVAAVASIPQVISQGVQCDREQP